MAVSENDSPKGIKRTSNLMDVGVFESAEAVER
jgi:hypothetical protein